MIGHVRVIRLAPHEWDVLVPGHPPVFTVRCLDDRFAMTIGGVEYGFFQTDAAALTAIFKIIAGGFG